jgi:ketosteroid isomerase-like protein
MRRSIVAVVFLCALGVTAAVHSAVPAVADEVIAITKEMWAAEARGDVAGSMKYVADDYTEFNAEYPTRLDGKAINMKLVEANIGGSTKTVAGDMANAKVQVYGDVAILTYNYIGASKDKDGRMEAVKAKSTRVYLKKDGKWWLVHANFAAAN